MNDLVEPKPWLCEWYGCKGRIALPRDRRPTGEPMSVLDDYCSPEHVPPLIANRAGGDTSKAPRDLWIRSGAATGTTAAVAALRAPVVPLAHPPVPVDMSGQLRFLQDGEDPDEEVVVDDPPPTRKGPRRRGRPARAARRRKTT